VAEIEWDRRRDGPKEDRWQKCRRSLRSRELGGSQGESPKVGCSKSRSCEIARSEDSHWIQVKGGPLDQSLIAYRAFGGSEVERTSSRLQKSRSAESRGTR
jgi:hypothetical protein